MANEFVARKGIISIGIISGSGDLNIANNGTIGGNLTVGGTLTAQEFKAELISSSIIYESGSTKFGDTLDDIHQRTGSFFISGTAFTVTSSNFNLLGTYTQNGTSNITGQLNVDNIRIDGNVISSQNTDGNIELTPSGNGDVYLNSDTVRIGDSNTAVALTTNGTGNLTLSTNAGTNSGTIVINQGVNGNIVLTPNGTGTINLAGNTNVTGTLNASTALTSSLLNIDNIRIDGNTISSTNTNGNIVLDANGNGIVDVKDGLIVTGSLIASSSLSVGTTSTANRFTFDGGNIGSPTFVSGFAGAGFRLQSGSTDPVGGSGATSGWKLELDHLSVRGTMKIYELLINQIRATNGSLWVSSVGKVETVIRSGSSSTFYLFFDTGSNSGSATNIGHGFFPGDLIRAQRFIWAGQAGSTGSRAEVYRSDLEVITVSGSIITASLRTGATAPSGGFEFVRIGSTSNPNRRGAVYLTADDNDAPFIDVIDQVNSFTAFESTAKNKVRMGKLNGITSPTFGVLSGSGGAELYGFWASGSAYLEGGINAAFGKIADLTITGSSIYTGTGTYSNTNTPFFLSSSGQLSLKDRFIWDGNNLFISGAITASAGTIANFFIDANNLWASNAAIGNAATTIVINSSLPKIALGPTANSITLAGTETGIFLSGSGEFKAYRNTNNYIRVSGNSVELRSENIALTGSNIEISANGASSKIRLGNVTTANDTGATTSGSYIDNLGNALFQRNANNYVQISGSQVVLRTENFVLSGSTLRLNSAAGGSFALGAILPTSHTSGNGIFLSGSGQALIGSASGARIQFDGSNLILSSSTFLLGDANNLVSGSGGNIRISGSNVNIQTPSFLFGNTANFISGSGGNIRISGSAVQVETPSFLLGNSTNFVSGSGGNIRISGSNVQIQTPSFYLGGATQFISGAGGVIQISSSNFHLLNGNLTASNAILSGTITAGAGSIGGWTIGADQLFASSSAGGLFLSASQRSLIMRSGSQETLLIGESVTPGTLVSSSISHTGGTAIEEAYFQGTLTSGSTTFYEAFFETNLAQISGFTPNRVIPISVDYAFYTGTPTGYLSSYTNTSNGTIGFISLTARQGLVDIGNKLIEFTQNGVILTGSISLDIISPSSSTPIDLYVFGSVYSLTPPNTLYSASYSLSTPVLQYQPILFLNKDGFFGKISPTTTVNLLAGGIGTAGGSIGGGNGTVTSINAGDGLTGGTIITTGTITIDTGSNHFISGARKTISVSDTVGASGIDLTYNSGTGVLSGTLQNSSITVGSTSISLGSTATTIAGLASITSTNITGSTISASGTITAGAFSGGSLSGTTLTTTGNAKLGDATADAHTATGSFGISGSFTVNGASTFTTLTTTGNAKIGDATSDTHTVTGSLSVSGSQSLVGDLAITTISTNPSITITDTSTNDPYIRFVPGTAANSFAIGIDDSDADKFKISYGTAAVLGTNDRLTIDTAGAVTISQTLTVSGNTTVNGNAKLGDAITDAHTVTGSLNVSGSFGILQSAYGAQISSSIGTGTTATVASIATGSYNGVFFDYTIGISNTGRRVGTVMTTWLPGGTSVEFTDYSTLDIGLTNGVEMTADIATGTIRLRANNTSGQTVEVRAITRAI